MYKFKTNKTEGTIEIYNELMNTHSSVLAINDFDKIFSREYARFEYFSLLAKSENGTSTGEDEAKIKLLTRKFDFDIDTKDYTDISDLHEELKPLMILTLFAHNKLLSRYGKRINSDGKIIENSNYQVWQVNFTLFEKNDFYKT